MRIIENSNLILKYIKVEDVSVGKPGLTEAMKNSIPVDLMFEVMAARLIPEYSITSFESAGNFFIFFFT